MGKLGNLIILAYILAAVYVLNEALKIVIIPENVLNYVDVWVKLIAGGLLVLGAYAFNFYNTRH